MSDAGRLPGGMPGAGAPDGGTPDAGHPDAGRPDAGAPDAGAKPKGKQLQLTFDDGPDPVASALRPILGHVATLGVKAGFFVIGEEVKTRHSAIAEITKVGHVIGNHSWDHMEKGTASYSDEDIYEQFRKTHAEVKSAGVDMEHWRAPRGEDAPRVAGILLRPKPPKRSLYTLEHCDWHADSKDAQGSSTASAMIKAIESDFTNTGIVPLRLSDGTRAWRLLFHVVDSTAKHLPDVLKHFASQGDRFIDFSQSR